MHNKLRGLLTGKRIASVAFLIATLACLPEYISAYTVAGPSEAPTLLLGDRVIVNRMAFDLRVPYASIRLARLGTPRRGDLVAFLVPNRGQIVGLKRVLGIPGDTLEMRENRLIINGLVMNHAVLPRANFDHVPPEHKLGTVVATEAGAGGNMYRITFTPGLSPLRTFGPMTLPADGFFLLGDHRDNSNDSRIFGPVSGKLITGKVVLILPAHRR